MENHQHEWRLAEMCNHYGKVTYVFYCIHCLEIKTRDRTKNPGESVIVI